MNFLKSLFAMAIYLITLVATYYIHISYFPVNVVFFSSIIDAIFAAFLTFFFLLLIGFLLSFSILEIVLMVCLWLLIGYSLAISVPTVVDRSLSFYILEKLQQRGGGIRLDAFQQIFTEEYIKEHRLMEIRLTEQLQSGTIAINEGCVKITKKGDNIASISRYFRNNWLPQKRLLMGEYTDVLTDPFRDSTDRVNYVCK